MISSGQNIDHFKILEKLGSGGMGDVFLAEDTKLGRKVALKFLSSDFFTDSERLGRFQREAKTAAQISHPNVTAIYDLGTFKSPDSDEESLYIVMEHVSGESLKHRLANSKTDLSEILRMAEKIGSGLSAAHKLGIVHRDIKADNILINEDGEPKILDFGLAKFADGAILQDSNKPESNIDDEDGDTISRELTQAGKIVGTVTYMSPEQARGEEIDTRSDIFSFGVLLYRMAAGEFPFTGPTQVSTLAKILEATQDPPSAKNNAIPPELERIITKCLQKSPADRYQNTRDLVLDLRSLRKQFDSGVSDSISSISSPSMAPVKTSSSKTKVIGFGAIAVLALIATYVFSPFGSDTEGSGQQVIAAENSIAILDFANKTNDPDLQWLESGLPEILLTDLTENQALSVISRGRILDHLKAKSNSAASNVSAEEMREACAAIGAASIISGSYYKIGDKIRIDARFEETSSGEVIWSEKVIGEDLFSLVDSLTDKIVQSLNVADLAPSDQQIADVMTSSPQAYRLYLEGVELMLSERSKEAQNLFQQAIEIDSSFGMAYLRLGMSHIFSGHNQKGQEILQKAKTFENKLPVRSRSLLDAYVDLFLTQNYVDGFTKMASYVKNYPTDKEARTFYGSILTLTQQDTAVAFAQFDTALAQDPTYQFALSTYGATLLKYDNFERAMNVFEQLLRFHPESPAAYSNLTAIHISQGNLDKAIEMTDQLRTRFPERRSALSTMVNLHLRLRQFDSAAYYSELYKAFDTTDHFAMISYYRYQGNLATWKGQFKGAIKAIRGRIKEATLSDDNQQLSSSYRALALTFFVIGQKDSALAYADVAFDLTPSVFNAISYPLTVISFDHSKGMELKSVFDSLATVFQSQVPQGMWSLVEALRNIYTGAYNYDTSLALSGLESICENPKYVGGGNLRELAEMQMHYGRFEEALKNIETATSDKFVSTGGYSTLNLLYIKGRAHQGLRQNDQAVEAYKEMLTYWGAPDIEIKIIREAKDRLARLTS